MSIKIGKSNILSLGLFFLYVSSTISYATTTVATNTLFDQIRLISATLTVFFLILFAAGPEFKKISAYSLLLFLGLSMHGLTLAYINDIDTKYLISLPISAGLILTFALYFSSKNEEIFGRSLVWSLISYKLVVLAVTIVTGGLKIGFPPVFHLEHLTAMVGVQYDLQYSQGTTKFYGLASILAAHLFLKSSGVQKVFLLLFTIAFLILMTASGARGDSAAAMLVIFILMSLRYGHSQVLIVFAALCLVVITFSDQLSDFFLITRFQTLQDDFGTRLSLLIQAWEILSTRADCLAFGCGFNFFQHYYDFDISRYPHNVIVEMSVVFGLPVTATLLVIATKGFKKKLRESGFLADVFLPLFIYFFLIGLKSGSILGSWFLMAGFIYFVAAAFTVKARHDGAV